MEHVDELIAGHALRALSSEDEERVVVHLAECERAGGELRETEAVAASLAYGVPAGRARRPICEAGCSPSPSPSSAAPAAPRRGPARSRPARPRWMVAAVRRRRRAGAWRSPSSGLVAWNVSLQNDLTALHAQLANGAAVTLPGVGNVVAKTDGNATLFASLRPAPAGKTYEAWVIRGKRRAPGGRLQGRRHGELHLKQPAKPGDKIAVTVEPAGGTKEPTTAPIATRQNV